jgi:hypothetical protein
MKQNSSSSTRSRSKSRSTAAGREAPAISTTRFLTLHIQRQHHRRVQGTSYCRRALLQVQENQ